MRRRIYSIGLSLLALTFAACNGGGGGGGASSSSASSATPTVPPPTVSGTSKAANDEPALVPDSNGNFVKLNSVDEGARGTITLKGQSD